jgi:hypothetical protein
MCACALRFISPTAYVVDECNQQSFVLRILCISLGPASHNRALAREGQDVEIDNSITMMFVPLLSSAGSFVALFNEGTCLHVRNYLTHTHTLPKLSASSLVVFARATLIIRRSLR